MLAKVQRSRGVVGGISKKRAKPRGKKRPLYRRWHSHSAQCGAWSILFPLVAAPTASQPPTFAQPTTPEELWQLLQRPQPQLRRVRHLGEALVQSGVMTSEQLQAALHQQAEQRVLGLERQLGQQLVEQGIITEAQLRHVIAHWLGNRVLDPSRYQFDLEALACVPHHVAEREAVLTCCSTTMCWWC